MQRSDTATPTVSREHFGKIGDTDVDRYVLANPSGITVRVLDLGGVIQSLEAPGRDGEMKNVVLGFPTLDGYVANNQPDAGRVFFGALIGRYANRIAGAEFTLDGEVHRVSANENGNSLHGGAAGFDTHVWQAIPFTDDDGAGLRLTPRQPGRRPGLSRPGHRRRDVTGWTCGTG
ncbi:aldose epimerase family protein [Lentzea indica]|uniref:aldose epimerase family protein n=1 Tax=Lentzea indica TaxID=2604800 RepID=UPI0024842901|nr:hypothetical protein [Lentzea indica]